MTGAATDLFDAAAQVLNFCAVVLDELPVGAPERQFIPIGYPAIDCPTLAVFLLPLGPGPFAPSTSPGDPLRQGHPYPVLDLVVFQVQVWRCWPSTPDGKQIAKAPKPEQYTNAAEILYRDTWQLWNAFREGFNLGLLDGPCKMLQATQAQAIQPDGGYAGVSLLVTAQIDGFVPEIPVSEP